MSITLSMNVFDFCTFLHREASQMELNRKVLKADYHGAILKGS